MRFLKRWIRKWQYTINSIQRNIQRKIKLIQLKINAIIRAIQQFFLRLWNKLVVIPCKFIVKWWNRLFWRHVVRFSRWVFRKTSFFRWKKFASATSEAEKERYRLFIEVLGGWKNIVAFKCNTKSWHLKIIHSFLIDWEKIPHFGIRVVQWNWPYLNLAIGSYSKWIFKRLRKTTKMPFRIKENKRAFK